MPKLTRRPHPERSDCWHVYYGDVQVGTIAVQAGMPLSVQQWRWDCGFYPPSHRGRSRTGYAAKDPFRVFRARTGGIFAK